MLGACRTFRPCCLDCSPSCYLDRLKRPAYSWLHRHRSYSQTLVFSQHHLPWALITHLTLGTSLPSPPLPPSASPTQFPGARGVGCCLAVSWGAGRSAHRRWVGRMRGGAGGGRQGSGVCGRLEGEGGACSELGVRCAVSQCVASIAYNTCLEARF